MKYLQIVFNKIGEGGSKQWITSIALAMVVLTFWTISLLLIGFNVPLYVISMLIVSALIFVTPTAGLPVIILGTMWFQRWFTLEPIVLGDVVYKLYPIDVVFLMTLLGLFFHQIFGKKKYKIRFKTIEWSLLFFMVLCFAYLLASFFNQRADAALSVSAFKNYAFYALLFFVVTVTIKSLDEIKGIIKVLLVGGWGIIFFVVAGIALRRGIWTEFNPLSTEGVRFLSFPHAFYLSVVLVITLILLLYKLRPERITIFTMWVQLVGVLGSLMRHLWMSIFFTAVFIFVAVPRRVKVGMAKFFGKNTAVLGLLGVIVAFVLIITPTSDVSLKLQEYTAPVTARARSLTQATRDSSARWRIFAWRAAQETVLSSPIVGVGYGIELVIDFDTYSVIIPMRDLHNSFLVLLVQMGIVGSIAFLYLLGAVFLQMYRAWKKKGMYWPYQLAFCSGLLVFLSAAFWQPYFETNFTGVFFWILLGMLVVSLRLDDGKVKIG